MLKQRGEQRKPAGDGVVNCWLVGSV